MRFEAMKLTPGQAAEALQHFTEYFVKNYPGPNTVIYDPKRHAPKIFRVALYAIEDALQADAEGSSNDGEVNG